MTPGKISDQTRFAANLPPLCEVLDAKNRVLCLMAHEEVLRQNLRHRAFAVILKERGGRFILSRQGENYGFLHYSFLPAGLCAEDAARAAIAAKLGEYEGSPILLGRIGPGPQSRMAITDIYLAELPKTTALNLEDDDRDWLFLKKDELFAFGDNDLLDIFLRHVMECGIFERKALDNEY